MSMSTLDPANLSASQVVTNVLAAVIQDGGDLLEPIDDWDGWICSNGDDDDDDDYAE